MPADVAVLVLFGLSDLSGESPLPFSVPLANFS